MKRGKTGRHSYIHRKQTYMKRKGFRLVNWTLMWRVSRKIRDEGKQNDKADTNVNRWLIYYVFQWQGKALDWYIWLYRWKSASLWLSRCHTLYVKGTTCVCVCVYVYVCVCVCVRVCVYVRFKLKIGQYLIIIFEKQTFSHMYILHLYFNIYFRLNR